MEHKSHYSKLLALVAAMLCALGAQAAEAYLNYTPSNTTLTFYYDDLKSSRPGTTYYINEYTVSGYPAWFVDGNSGYVTRVVFDSSFAEALPTKTNGWFLSMCNLQSITGMNYLNTSRVTNMADMFSGCNRLTNLDVSNFNTSIVKDMSGMFSGCSGLKSLDVSNFNTSMTKDMGSMFSGCTGLKSLDVSNFNTSAVNNMASMFAACIGLTSLDVSAFNTSSVTRMNAMFCECFSLTRLNLENFVTAKVENMTDMFNSCSNLTTIIVGQGWSTDKVSKSDAMFENCTSLVGGMGTTYDANHVDKTYAHIDGGPSNPGYFTKPMEAYACYTPSNTTLTFYYDNLRSSRTGTTYDLNTGTNFPGWKSDNSNTNVTEAVFDPSFANARPTSTYYWFSGMISLESITGINYLNTSEVTEMRYMFYNCSQLNSLDVSGFNTAKVTYMGYMFTDCSSLTSIDLSSFDTHNVTAMNWMFRNCSSLVTIYVGTGWSTQNVTSSTAMFNNCRSLVGGKGTTYDSGHQDAAYAHVDGGPSDPGYFTAKSTALRGDVNHDGQIKINDVTDLINYLLSGDASAISLDAADCDQDGNIRISDVTALINYLLSGTW